MMTHLFLMVQNALPDPSAANFDLSKFLADTLAAGAAKDWRVFAALLLIGAVFVMRKFAAKIPGKFGAFWSTDRGGATMALVGGVIGAIGHTLAAKMPWSWNMIPDGLLMAVTAAGGWAVFKKLVSPSDAPVAPAAPAPDAPSDAGSPAAN